MKLKYIVAFSYLALCSFAFGEDTASKPNVIYILADDLGMGDLGVYGQKKLKTPNIDRLAHEGMIFSDHYSGNTVCSPSRAVLMTGQHPGNVHCRGNGDENHFALNSKMTTLPRLFKNAGYATGAFGKWGLGETNLKGAQNPLTHGFDHFTGWKSQRIAHTYYPSSIVRDGVEIPLEKDTFVHDFIMKDAMDFIKNSVEASKPFFCYIPTAVPHAAMHAPKEMHEKWCEVYSEFNDVIGKYSAGATEECPDVKNPIAGFAAMMENFDNQVGEILDMLVQLGIDENTVVIFSSDNGTHIEGGHKPNFWDSNGPLRGHKRDLYEGGIRTPFLVRWPGKVQAGSSSAHISAFWDVLPTMAELINQPIPEQSDGISIVPTLLSQGEQQKHKYLYHEFIDKGAKPYSSRSLRYGDWKAVQRAVRNNKKKKGGSQPGVYHPIELYNLKNDLGEKKDVAKQNPELVSQIEGFMDEAHTPLAELPTK
ncbi:arylsulfatase [Akkermansiaceae bacterium]|nr:arylsulfatase [Akkermansiaceae bacterium]